MRLPEMKYSDGLKYYISMVNQDGRWQLFVFDSQRSLWHREDETRAVGWACLGGELYLLKEDGGLWRVNGNVSTDSATATSVGPPPAGLELKAP